jgi:hypothetical protein
MSADLYLAEVLDNSVYVFTCPRGHTTASAMREPKYQILFDIGVFAIIDGYYGEAVRTFAASLERFYEFAVRVMARRANVTEAALDAGWMHISKQSERQLGGYVVAYLMTHGTQPPLLQSKWVELRNDVIHRGRIPTSGEATNYGDQVACVIFESYKLLIGKYEKELNECIDWGARVALELASKSVGTGVEVRQFSYPRTLSKILPDTKAAPSVQATIEEFSAMRIRFAPPVTVEPHAPSR